MKPAKNQNIFGTSSGMICVIFTGKGTSLITIHVETYQSIFFLFFGVSDMIVVDPKSKRNIPGNQFPPFQFPLRLWSIPSWNASKPSFHFPNFRYDYDEQGCTGCGRTSSCRCWAYRRAVTPALLRRRCWMWPGVLETSPSGQVTYYSVRLWTKI